MKVIITSILIIFFSLQLSAQGERQYQDTIKKSGMMQGEPPDAMAKPVFEATNGVQHMKVWITPFMKGMTSEDMNKNLSDDTAKKGTHHVMVEITDAVGGQEVTDATVRVLAVSPSGKNSAIDLQKMMGQYGGNLNLDEKGDYELNISIDVNGTSNLTPFKYTVN